MEWSFDEYWWIVYNFYFDSVQICQKLVASFLVCSNLDSPFYLSVLSNGQAAKCVRDLVFLLNFKFKFFAFFLLLFFHM